MAKLSARRSPCVYTLQGWCHIYGHLRVGYNLQAFSLNLHLTVCFVGGYSFKILISCSISCIYLLTAIPSFHRLQVSLVYIDHTQNHYVGPTASNKLRARRYGFARCGQTIKFPDCSKNVDLLRGTLCQCRGLSALHNSGWSRPGHCTARHYRNELEYPKARRKIVVRRGIQLDFWHFHFDLWKIRWYYRP